MLGAAVASAASFVPGLGEQVAEAFVQWSDYLDGLHAGGRVIAIKRKAS